jgi:hypothetical protein
MLSDHEVITNYIKLQTESFLTELEDFYPFGVAIMHNGEVKPLAAYLDEDELSVKALLPILENHIQDRMANQEYRLGAVALAVVVIENELSFDAIQIRFYHLGRNIEHINLKYFIYEKKTTLWL